MLTLSLLRKCTYKVVHGKGNIIQHFYQKLFPYKGCDVSVPFCKSLPADKRRTTIEYKVHQRETLFHFKANFLETPTLQEGERQHNNPDLGLWLSELYLDYHRQFAQAEHLPEHMTTLCYQRIITNTKPLITNIYMTCIHMQVMLAISNLYEDQKMTFLTKRTAVNESSPLSAACWGGRHGWCPHLGACHPGWFPQRRNRRRCWTWCLQRGSEGLAALTQDLHTRAKQEKALIWSLGWITVCWCQNPLNRYSYMNDDKKMYCWKS